MPQIRGKFGNDEEKLWPVTFGMNPKGGMDEAEFEKYLSNSIFPLYPDVKDVMGKRVMLKVDSGAGRLNMEAAGLLSSAWVCFISWRAEHYRSHTRD